MRRFPQPGGRIAVLPAVLLFGASCTAVGDGESTESASLPLTDLLNSALGAVNSSEGAANPFIAECMEAQGFQISFPPSSPFEPGFVPDLPPLDLAGARADGYGAIARPSPPERSEIDPGIGLSEADRLAWDEAFFGTDDGAVTIQLGDMIMSVPGNGCLAEGRRHVAGPDAEGLQGLFMNLQILAAQADARVASDPEMQQVVTHWRRCMEGQGYAFDDPFDALGWVVRNLQVFDGVSAEEAAQAEADARCRELSGYDSARRNVRQRIEEIVIKDNEQLVLAWREIETRLQERGIEPLAR